MVPVTPNSLISRLLRRLGMSRIERSELRPWFQEISIDRKGEVVVLSCNNIILVEAQGDFVSFATAGGTYRKPGTISHFERNLDPDVFLRIHRSTIVNKKKIARVSHLTGERLSFHMSNDKVVSSSGTYQKAIIKALPDLA